MCHYPKFILVTFDDFVYPADVKQFDWPFANRIESDVCTALWTTPLNLKIIIFEINYLDSKDTMQNGANSKIN